MSRHSQNVTMAVLSAGCGELMAGMDWFPGSYRPAPATPPPTPEQAAFEQKCIDEVLAMAQAKRERIKAKRLAQRAKTQTKP